MSALREVQEPRAGVPARAAGAASAVAPPGDGPLDLVLELAAALDAEGVRYCHWKSNASIARALAGDDDLDLLVSRADAQRFEAVLRRLGFREAALPRWKELPGVVHAYGLDRGTGRLVHVHLHHRLVVGDDMTKNYHLPIEEAYVASAGPGDPLPVPAPEFELGLLLVRLVLKHCAWDAIASLQGSLSASERRELADLGGRVDPERVWDVLGRHLPVLERPLLERCRRSLEPGVSPWFRARTAAMLERALASCARRGRRVDVWLKLWRRGRTFVRRKVLRRGPDPKRLGARGALVAIVGSDGAGKTTVVRDLAGWLGKEFRVRTVHLGRPPRSALSTVVKGLLSLAARLRRAPMPSGPLLRASLAQDGAALGPRATARLAWEVMTARDRWLAYRRARRAASNGAIVLCDRFPLAGVTTMDAGVGARPDGGPRGRAAHALLRLERRLYRRILPPDVLIVLRLPPDLAVARKPEEREERVRPRAAEVWTMDWGATGAVVIDAARPLPEVLLEVRSAVWSRL
ncbi:MAG TPA: hypothetical protein VNP94_10175 [Actinomycetota bacterium]|nr:hypothetical protein [Actinomycetota bacterium]